MIKKFTLAALMGSAMAVQMAQTEVDCSRKRNRQLPECIDCSKKRNQDNPACLEQEEEVDDHEPPTVDLERPNCEDYTALGELIH